jgi:hypothetical protein
MTRDNLPIACSLTAAELETRVAEMGALGTEALVTTTRDSSTLTLRFRGGREVHGRVRDVAAAETQCCGFLEIAVEEHGDEATLRIQAPPGAEPVLDDLMRAFNSSAMAA